MNDEPNKKPHYILGQDISDLSINELEELKNILTDEINRFDTAIQQKQADRQAAQNFFNL